MSHKTPDQHNMEQQQTLFFFRPPTKMTANERQTRRWEDMNPEILSLIFVKIKEVDEMMRTVPFVCKPWMEVLDAPYCWSNIDIQKWCRRSNDGNAVDLVVKKLIRRSKWSVQSFSAFRMGEPGFFYVAHCGNFLKVLKIPMSSITDQMVLKHIKPLPNLTTLDISNCFKITKKGIAAFGNQCKSLVNLRRNMSPLEACSPIDDSETKAIAETMPNLKQIGLCFGRFGDMGLSEILTKCKSLAHLDIQGSWNVELNGDLEERCERLEHFQNPWDNYENDFCDSGGSDDDESEQESESD